MGLQIVVLGAAAGGGLPQWNCNCKICEAARKNKIPCATQSSVAFSVNGDDWAIINASPDLRYQMVMNSQLHPRSIRDTPIKSVLLTNGDIDHIAGLLTMREMQAFTVYATNQIHSILTGNKIFNVLNENVVKRRTVDLNKDFSPLKDTKVTFFAVPGKEPLYSEGEVVHTSLMGEQTVGVHINADGKSVFYIPGCALIPNWLKERIDGSDLLLFDGTLWEDSEMITSALGKKTGARMGHISMSGKNGSIAELKGLDIKKKIFIHINNSNPVWDPNSEARNLAESSGWQIAQDGMVIQI